MTRPRASRIEQNDGGTLLFGIFLLLALAWMTTGAVVAARTPAAPAGAQPGTPIYSE